MALKKVSPPSTRSSSSSAPVFTGPGRLIVISKRSGSPQVPRGYTVIDVDRTNPILGNHLFSYTPATNHDREHQIQTFEKFLNHPDTGKQARIELDKIGQRIMSGERIALRCWCAPKDCHARVEQSYIMSKITLDTRPSGVLIDASTILYPWANGINQIQPLSIEQHYKAYRASLQDIDDSTVPTRGAIRTWFHLLKSNDADQIVSSINMMWKSRVSSSTMHEYTYLRGLFNTPQWHEDLYARIGKENYRRILHTLFNKIDDTELGSDESSANFYASAIEFLTNPSLSTDVASAFSEVLGHWFVGSMREYGRAGYMPWVTTWFLQDVPESISNHVHTEAFFDHVMPELAKYFMNLTSIFEYDEVSDLVNPMPALSIKNRAKLFSMMDNASRIRYAVELTTGKHRAFPDGIEQCIIQELEKNALLPMHFSKDYLYILDSYLSGLNDDAFEEKMAMWKDVIDLSSLHEHLAVLLPTVPISRQKKYSTMLHLDQHYMHHMLTAIDKISDIETLKKSIPHIIEAYAPYLPVIFSGNKHVFEDPTLTTESLEQIVEKYINVKALDTTLTAKTFLSFTLVSHNDTLVLQDYSF